MFCSDATADAGEPLLGSAARGQRHILISHPKGAWAAKALKAPELLPIAAWAADYDRVHGGKTVVRLFAPEAAADGVELRVFPRGVRLDAGSLAVVPGLLDEVFGSEEPRGDPCPRTIAVCTHGKHDRCCALHGQAFFTALRDLAQPSGELEVVEASHLGGHRFAGTCLDLRPGQPTRMYGRLQREEAEPLLRHLLGDRVWLARYRGRCDLESGGQIAEAQALALGARGEVTVERLDDARFRAVWPGGETVTELRESRFTSKAACSDEPTERLRMVLA